MTHLERTLSEGNRERFFLQCRKVCSTAFLVPITAALLCSSTNEVGAARPTHRMNRATIRSHQPPILNVITTPHSSCGQTWRKSSVCCMYSMLPRGEVSPSSGDSNEHCPQRSSTGQSQFGSISCYRTGPHSRFCQEKQAQCKKHKHKERSNKRKRATDIPINIRNVVI